MHLPVTFLADLSRLIPSTYSKKGRGRIEKTEIIEMAIKHLKHLQSLSPIKKGNNLALELRFFYETEKGALFSYKQNFY